MNDVIPGLLGYNASAPLLFTQFYFWMFFLVVLVACALIGKRIAMRNTFLCAASFFFYYKSSGIFVTILIFTNLRKSHTPALEGRMVFSCENMIG